MTEGNGGFESVLGSKNCLVRQYSGLWCYAGLSLDQQLLQKLMTKKRIKKVVSGEVIPSNTLSLEEHVDRIQGIQNQIKTSMFDLASSIKSAIDQLGLSENPTTRYEFTNAIGISESNMYKWKRIAESQFIHSYQHLLPDVFSSLYDITTLEQKIERYISDNPEEVLQKLVEYVDTGRLHLRTKQTEVKELIKGLEKRHRGQEDLSRENRVREQIAQKSHPEKALKSSIGSLVKRKKSFKSFVIQPSVEVLEKYSGDDVYVSTIREELPICDLRDTHHRYQLICCLSVPNKYLQVGMKFLDAFGFKYSQMNLDSSGEPILIGFRGKPKTVDRTETNPFIICEVYGNHPFISVWAKDRRRNQSGWSKTG